MIATKELTASFVAYDLMSHTVVTGREMLLRAAAYVVSKIHISAVPSMGLRAIAWASSRRPTLGKRMGPRSSTGRRGKTVVEKVKLTVKDGGLAGRDYEFAQTGRYTIGRANDCDLAIPNDLEFKDVSRHHCILDLDGRVVRVRDIGSRNGTHLNGMQIGRPANWQLDRALAQSSPWSYDVHDGDELAVGHLRFQVSVLEPNRATRESTPIQMC